MSTHSLIFLLSVLMSVEWACGKRTWQSNLNFNDPQNWLPRLPCPRDRLVLSTQAPLVLALPGGETKIRGLVLGGDVEVVLSRDGNVTLTLDNLAATVACTGQDVVFKHTRPLTWTDPGNWDGWTKATPDLERIPCTQEDVQFPRGATFNVVTPPTLKLRSLEINGVVIDSFGWYLQSGEAEVGWQLHKPDGDAPDLEFSNTNCLESKMWCECRNDYLHSEICTADCPLPLCNNPVRPDGFCCDICGAYFLMTSKDQEKIQFTAAINSFLKNKDVVWHASKVGELIQIVLVERGDYSGEIAAVADDLKVLIEKHHTGWRVEKLFVSGHVWYPTSFVQVAGHFLSLMVFAALTIAAIVVFYSENWSWLDFSSPEGRPFVFARFENQSGEVVVTHEQRQPDPPTPPQAFDNPMYGTAGQEQRNVTVENPVYTELEEFPESCGSSSTEESVILNSPDVPKC